MLKKILIAAVAVVAGLVVLNHSSLVKTYWNKMCHSAKRMVPPEVRLQQLNTEIANIDKDIKKNLSKLASMEVDVNMFEDKLKEDRKEQAHVRADIVDMRKALEVRGENVVFRKGPISATQLTDRLEMAVTKFTGLKERIKVQEELLANKKRTLEAAYSRISEMKNEKEKLRVLATKLETHLETVRLKQVQNQEITFDDSAISNAREIAKDVEIQLRTAEKAMELRAQFGYADKVPDEKPTKNRDEVLKSARQALEDDEPAAFAVEPKDQ
jgi:chromosome segregation ATPase